ncbi:MAG: chemotaxis protein CheX [Pseudoxanthomonas sp.]
MAAKFFGQFLLEKGVISPQQLLEALDAQRASNPTLGELAQQRGLLTAAQAKRINDRQRVEDRRFGDIAEDMGLLDSAQVNELLAAQKAQRKLFGEILVEQDALDRTRLEAELAAHRQEQDDAARLLGESVSTHPLSDLATSAINTSVRLFPRLFGSHCQPAQALTSADALSLYSISAQVRIEAEQPMVVGLACSAETATRLATAFLSIPPERCDDELALDALGEVVNVLMGYVVRDALSDDAQYRAFPPDTRTSAAAAMAASPCALAIAMTSQLGDFALLLAR